MKKQTEKNLIKGIKGYFYVKNPIRNFLIFFIMCFFAALIKIGVLISEEIINSSAFNAYAWGFMLGIQTLILILAFEKLEGYFILPGTLILLWAILNNTVNLVSVASNLLALSILIHISMIVFPLLFSLIKEKPKKKCKKK